MIIRIQLKILILVMIKHFPFMNKKLNKKFKFCMQTKIERLIVEKKLAKIQKLLINSFTNDKYTMYLHYYPYEYDYWGKIETWIYDSHYDKQNLRVIDIGCAYGTLSIFCKKYLSADVTAIDFVDCYTPVELFRKLDIDYKAMNIETDDLNFGNEFDIIILTEVLEHFNFNPIPTLKKLKAILKSDGVIYISTPNAKYWGKIDLYKKLTDIPNVNPNSKIRDIHIWQYSITELLYVIHEAELEIKDLEYSMNGWQFNLIVQHSV